ncbi:hypothetical protein OROHE_023586 [Orobanche hederae]
MDTRRKRKSMWDMEEETKQFSGINERNSSREGGHYHEFPASRSFASSKFRDYSEQQSQESKGDSVAPMNGDFIESGGISPEGKEIGGGDRYCQNMSLGYDGIERHKHKHSLEDDQNDPHRHSRRDRSRRRKSRSRSRSWSRSNSSPSGRTRSRSPIRDYRNQSHKWSDQKSVRGKSFRICRDFSAGRCPRGSQCKFVHSKNSSRVNISEDSCSKSDLRGDVSDYNLGENAQFQSRSRNAVPCREFAKGKCRWGDACRFSHHLDNPSDNSNAKNDSRLGRDMDEENMGNKQENQDASSNVREEKQDHVVENNIVALSLSDVLDEVKDSRNPSHPIPFSGQNLNQNFVDVTSGHFFVPNAADDGHWQSMIWHSPSNGFNGDINGPEAQLEARLDLQNHQKAVQMTGLLETKVTPAINNAAFPTTTFDIVNFQENADTHTPIFIVDTKLDNANVDNSESSKPKEESVLANPEADGGNKFMREESKENQNNKDSEDLDARNKKVDGSIANKDEKVVGRIFKNSLIEFVKDILKPAWKEGRLSKDDHKIIVKKVVEKVTSSIQADHIPRTQDKVDQYLSFSKPKIAKLVQAYVERSRKTDS